MRNLARFVVMCFLTVGSANLTDGQTVDDGGLWLAVFAQDKLGDDESPWKLWFDGHLRFLDDTDGFNQSLFRPGVGRQLTDQLTLWGGYCWIHTSPILGDEFDEHRIWQQFTWVHSHDLWTLTLRPRFEQRFLEIGDDVGLRFRQFTRLQRQLASNPRLSVIVWDELFFHVNDTDWGARAGFDQNRAFLGLGIKRSPDSRLRLEIGYLNQYINLPTAADRSHHILSINLFY